jgi:ubiquinone/menaquinone biosynthesis C-methylase UbiE
VRPFTGEISINKPGKTEISPVTRTHAQARRNYDHLSRWYDRLEAGWERIPREKALARLEMPYGSLVLEIGCGTGTSLLDLAGKAGPFGIVIGVDLSRGMLRVASPRIWEGNSDRSVFLVQSDALEIPLPSRILDAVFMSFTLELFDIPEIPLLLSECHRILKPGASLCILAVSKNSGNQFMNNFYEFCHSVFPVAVDCRPIYVEEALKNEGFQICSAESFPLWGIGMEIVRAINP